MGEVKDIPKGWERVALNDIAEINPSLNKSQLADDMLFPFVPMPSVGAGDGRINITTERPFSEVKKGYTPFQSGDVLFAKITPCMENGKIAVVPHLKDQYGFGSTEFHVIRPLAGTDSHYIFYFVSRQEFRNIAASKMTGAVGQKRVPTDFIKHTPVPLPPLPEQHRIVARIEELFSDLDKGIESLKTAQQQLKVYRQAVLKWAFEGRLTNKDIKEGELPRKWRRMKLKDIANEKDGLRRGPFGSAIKKEFFVPDGYKVYEQSNAIYDDAFRGSYFIDEKKYQELKNFNLRPGDLIVSCSGTLGKIAEIPTNAKPGVINQALLRIRLLDDIVSKKYFLYYFRSAPFQRKIIDQSQGTAMSNLIGIKDFKEIELHIPPIDEQNRIVSEIEDRLSVCDKMEESISQSLQQAEALRQSILKKAFEGKLVPQDPNDEPAGVLLERIRAEKDKSLKKTVGARTTINKRG